MHTIIRRWAAFLGNMYLHMAESSQTPRFLKIRCLSQGPCFTLHQSHALPVCAALSRVGQLTAVTPKGVGLGWCKRLLTGCFKATGMGIESDLRVGEWRKTLFFFPPLLPVINTSKPGDHWRLFPSWTIHDLVACE